MVVAASLITTSAIVLGVGKLVGDRMTAAGNGFEMAFYLSPIIFATIDFFLVAAFCVGLVGLFAVRTRQRPPLAFVAAVAMAILLFAPW